MAQGQGYTRPVPVTFGAGAEVAISDGVNDLDVYQEGDSDATITGLAAMMEVAGNALAPLQGSVADGQLVNLGTNNDVSLNAGTNNEGDVDVLTVNGFAAHDAGIAGTPLVAAGVAQSLDGTAPPNRVSTEADAVRMAMDFEGGQFVHPHGVQIWNTHLDSAAAVQTDTSIAGGDPGDGFAVFVTDLVFSIGAATASTVFLEEGSTKILGPYYLPATIGTGLSIHFVVPHRCTASTAVTVSTTGSIVYGLDVHGFIAAL
jgi:hypothetical protein